MFGVFVHGFSAPPAGCAVGVVVEESCAGFVVCPAAALLGFGEFAVLHVGLGSWVWWVCEGLNLMDQRVLATVVVGLWLADCSPCLSHVLCCIVLLLLCVVCGRARTRTLCMRYWSPLSCGCLSRALVPPVGSRPVVCGSPMNLAHGFPTVVWQRCASSRGDCQVAMPTRS